MYWKSFLFCFFSGKVLVLIFVFDFTFFLRVRFFGSFCIGGQHIGLSSCGSRTNPCKGGGDVTPSALESYLLQSMDIYLGQ